MFGVPENLIMYFFSYFLFYFYFLLFSFLFFVIFEQSPIVIF